MSDRPYLAIAKQYAADVLSGAIPASKWTRLACERFRRDLEREADPAWPWEMAEWRAVRACAFVELLPHVKGKWSGELIVLEPWQVFIFVNLYGFVDKTTKYRRFRRAFVFVPRKDGKTVTAAATGLLMFTVEAEPGAEIYCGATSEDQANEVFRPAKAMAERASGFVEHFGITVAAKSIFRENGLSFFHKLIGKPGEGQSPYCAIHDEYHEHQTSEQVDTMDTGMGARQEPLQLIITTAGVDISSPCKEFDDYARKVLDGVLDDEKLFVLIYCADEGDDWENWDTWVKANPNLGVSVSEEYLRDKLREAKQRVSQQNIIRTKHLNEWMNSGSAWIDPAMWAKLADPALKIEDFRGERCWAGLDLASKIDLCALVLLFQRGDLWFLFSKHYLPEETAEKAQNQHFQRWAKEGWLTLTEGARTDFAYIERDLKEIAEHHALQELGFDPRESGYLVANIQEWASFQCVEIAQGPAHMSEPMKELEAIIHSGTIRHAGDPLFAWQLSNVIIKQGRGGGPIKTYYPTKQNNESKIDGPVAAIMALSRAKLDTGGSVYETRGVLTLGEV